MTSAAAHPELFNPRLYREPRSFTLVRRVLIVVFSVNMVFATISGYRAIVQVKSLDLTAPSVITPGATVSAHGASWNRNHVTIRVLLRQGAAAETLGVHVIPTSWIASWNPIPQYGRLESVITPAQLARFRAGPAVVRAIAVGRPKWMRTPPPTVVEQHVQIKLP